MILDNVDTLSSGSRKIVNCSCDLQESKDCYKIYKRRYRDVKIVMNNNHGKVICKACCMIFKKKYSCDEDFFETIDTEEKAYWLGFIAADGCVLKEDRLKYPHLLKIKLANKDLIHLCKFRDGIGSDNPIKKIDQDGYKLCSICIYSTKICKDLIKLGIVPNKSLILNVNIDDIPKYLHRHFWRGYFDGDGGYHLDRKNNWGAEIAGTKQMLKSFVSFLKSYRIHERTITKKKNIYVVKYRGNIVTKKVSHILYSDSCVFLDRKFKQYKQIQRKKTRNKYVPISI
jgi:hypothetical protein